LNGVAQRERCTAYDDRYDRQHTHDISLSACSLEFDESIAK